MAPQMHTHMKPETTILTSTYTTIRQLAHSFLETGIEYKITRIRFIEFNKDWNGHFGIGLLVSKSVYNKQILK